MKTKHTILIWVALLLSASVSWTSCGGTESKKEDGKPYIVVTTGMIRDAVEKLAGDLVTVEALMGPGVDPHLYKATQGDLRKLREADLVLYNGLHLEGKMGEVLEKLAKQKPVIAVSENIKPDLLLKSATFADAVDPHIWFDVSLWTEAVRRVSQALSTTFPDIKPTCLENMMSYESQLQALHTWVKEQIATIPEQQRVMITAHDAFEYFGHAYNIEVRGLQGISTISEYGLQDVSNLVNFITERKIKAVFVESSVPRKSLEAVIQGCEQKGHKCIIGGTLYSDAMGAEGTPEGTYYGMVKYNVNTIVENLK